MTHPIPTSLSAVNVPLPARPKIAETVIDSEAMLREAKIGTCCEIHGRTCVEYTTLGDYSYIGHDCMVADAAIGKFMFCRRNGRARCRGSKQIAVAPPRSQTAACMLIRAWLLNADWVALTSIDAVPLRTETTI